MGQTLPRDLTGTGIGISLRPVGSQGRNRLDLAAVGHCAVLWEGRQESVVAGGRPRLPLLGMRNKTQAG